MLNQKKLLTEDYNPILDLVKYEKNIKQIDAEKPVRVQLEKGGDSLRLTHDGVELEGRVDRPLKHQIGSRIWGKTKEFIEIDCIWQKKFSTDPSGLENDLSSVFKDNDLSIRYETDNKGKNKIYGIVTPHFIDVDQLDFRQNFLKTIRKNTTLKPRSCGVKISQYGQITEFFKIDSPGFQTSYKYGLVYAKNNGYEAYRVNWERAVLICANGLTQWKGSQYRWKHTKEIDLNNFITDTIREGIENQHFIEERIDASKETFLKQWELTQLMERLSLAQASKIRLKNRLDVDLKEVGNNEWALSQAFTWLGSHEKYIPFSVKPKLIDLGTKILEKSLSEILQTEVPMAPNGFYGFLLPVEFLKNRQRLN
jgi:hypothetical protein